MQVGGMLLCLTTYVLLGLNIYAYFSVIAPLLKKRLGVIFGLIWVAIGMALVYNLVFNHFFAAFIKPGNPTDLKDNERLRKETKNRENRKAAKVNVDAAPPSAESRGSGADQNVHSEDDRFEGL
jgi:hypothetical protein